MAKLPNKKSYIEIMHEYLLSEGAIELTDEDRKTDWYKEEMESIKNISCQFENDNDFKEPMGDPTGDGFNT